MALTRKEQIVALTAFVKHEYSDLGRLIEDTANLSQPKKIDALGSLIQVAVEVERVSYDRETKQHIDDLMSVVIPEEEPAVLRPVEQASA